MTDLSNGKRRLAQALTEKRALSAELELRNNPLNR